MQLFVWVLSLMVEWFGHTHWEMQLLSDLLSAAQRCVNLLYPLSLSLFWSCLCNFVFTIIFQHSSMSNLVLDSILDVYLTWVCFFPPWIVLLSDHACVFPIVEIPCVKPEPAASSDGKSFICLAMHAHPVCSSCEIQQQHWFLTRLVFWCRKSSARWAATTRIWGEQWVRVEVEALSASSSWFILCPCTITALCSSARTY